MTQTTAFPHLESGTAGDTDAEHIQHSIAISLKRIADVLDGTAAGLCVTETLLGGRRPE